MLISTDPWIGSDSLTRAAMIAHEYTLHEWYPVANTTARAQLVTDLGTAGITISASNPVRVYRADATAGAEHEISEDGSTWVVVPSLAAWQSGTYASNWQAVSGSQAPRVRHAGDVTILSSGRVERTGSDLAVTAGTLYTVLTIPSGWRPSSVVASPCVLRYGSVPVFGEVVVLTTGEVQIRPSANGTISSSSFKEQALPHLEWPR